ncbi:MAG TPA: peptidoglycan-binding domain-containing protein [Alphaproteobacteria bacterium]
MTTMKTFAFAALLSATAIGFTLPANAEGGTRSSASGAGVSAGSSVGASGSTNGAGNASDVNASNSTAISGSVIGSSNQDGAGGTMNDNGSGTDDDYANSSTSRSQVLGTSDSSSSDTISANGAKDNTNRTVGQSATNPAVAATVLSFDTLQGSQITSIQRTLLDQGFRVGSADGVWGPKSAAALRDFQARNNLAVTGQLDSPTVTALNMGDTLVIRTDNDVRVMNDANMGSTADAPIDGPDAEGRLNGNSSTTGTDSGSGTGY